MPRSPTPDPLAILDALPAPVVCLDLRERYTFLNTAAETATMWPRADALGRTPAEIGIPPHICEEVSRKIVEVAATGQPTEYVVEYPGPTGLVVYRVTLVPHRDATGAVSGVVGLGTDVTALVHSDRALRESEERHRQTVEAAFDAIVTIDPAGLIVGWNRGAKRVFGYTAEEVMGRSVALVIPNRYLADHRTALSTFDPDRSSCVQDRILELVGVRKGGEECPVEVALTHWGTGADRRFTAIIRDVTERKHAEDARRELEADLRAKEQQQKDDRQLLHSQKLESLGVLAGGIAHDFNNLLTGILGYASLSRMRVPQNDPIVGDMKRIETATERAAELCQQLLAYAGRGQFVVKPVDLNTLTQEMAQLLGTVLSKKAVLKYDLTSGLPRVQADATQLRQVVMNLITNASDALETRSGVITLTTGLIDADAHSLAEIQDAEELTPGRYVYLEVSDTGCGMTDDVRAKIFDPFFTTKFTGRGLGLAAVQGIVRAHRGAIQVHTQLGKGTTFQALFPALDHPSDVAADVPAVPVMGGRGRRILVVDDEEDVRVFARKVLELSGFAVTVAVDGLAGVEAIAAEPAEFTLVLLDLTVPRLSGSDAYREMRRHQPDVRVVLTSGFAAQQALSGFAGKGLVGFLRKPYRSDDLLKIIFDAVGV